MNIFDTEIGAQYVVAETDIGLQRTGQPHYNEDLPKYRETRRKMA